MRLTQRSKKQEIKYLFGMTDMIHLNQAVEWKQFGLEQVPSRLVIDIFQSAEVSFCIIQDADTSLYLFHVI